MFFIKDYLSLLLAYIIGIVVLPPGRLYMETTDYCVGVVGHVVPG